MPTTVIDIIEKRKQLAEILSKYNIEKIVFFKGVCDSQLHNFNIHIETGSLKNKKHPSRFELWDVISALFCCGVKFTVNDGFVKNHKLC